MFTSSIDLGFFVLYLCFNIFVGLWVSRRRMSNARDYFLAGDQLPWYAIGGSIILKTAVGHVPEYNPQRQLTEEVSIAERIRSN